MQLYNRFLEHINTRKLFRPQDRLILAVSGGLDSVVLTHLCLKAGFDVMVAHCNFRLRGEESERDEAFVRQLAQQYNLEIRVKHFDTATYAAENKLSIQEAARLLRYTWFEELVKEQSAANDQQMAVYLLTAHHADDNAETLLMHFCRGTGLRGLTGIPAVYGHICRPLLDFSRQELADYATAEGLAFVEDSSNTEEKYTRNFFRHTIIPAIETVYPQVKENLAGNIRRFQSIEALYQLGVQQLIQKLCRQKGVELHIPVKQLLQYNNRALVYEIIRPYGFTEKQIDEVLKLAKGASGSYLVSPMLHYRIIRHRHWLIVAPDSASGDAAHQVVEAGDNAVSFAEGLLKLELMDAVKANLNAGDKVAFVDAALLQYPLLLRRWKEGDYFYPLGMRKKKKLARFFIDRKLSRTEKEKIWVIESAQRIVWILGQRIDDRFKVTEATKRVVRLEWE